jgi:hypothetical protein
MYDSYLGDGRVGFVAEPEGIETYWRACTQRRSYLPKIWNDAYLAAFAHTVHLQVVTLDKWLPSSKA